MKYILTESQYNLILESERYINLFQDLIDKKLEYIKKVCLLSSEDYQGDVGAETCDQIEFIEKIEVESAGWVNITHNTRPVDEKYMSVKMIVYFSDLHEGFLTVEDLTYDLEQILRRTTGMPILLNYRAV